MPGMKELRSQRLGDPRARIDADSRVSRTSTRFGRPKVCWLLGHLRSLTLLATDLACLRGSQDLSVDVKASLGASRLRTCCLAVSQADQARVFPRRSWLPVSGGSLRRLWLLGLLRLTASLVPVTHPSLLSWGSHRLTGLKPEAARPPGLRGADDRLRSW